MSKSHFGRRFHDLKYFEVGIFSYIFLEFTINLRPSLQKFVERYQLDIILSFLNIFQTITRVPNISTCTLLAMSSKICRLFLRIKIVKRNCLALQINVFSNVYDFFLHKIQSKYIVLNHFHVNLSRGNGVVYLIVLALCIISL